MRCKRIMLSATVLAASALAIPALAADKASAQMGAHMGTSSSATMSATPAMPATPATPAVPGTAGTRATPAIPATPATPASASSSTSMHTATSASGVPLVSLSDPKAKIISASVQTKSGQSIGTVQSVETNAAGKSKLVDVTLTTSTGATKTVQIRASRLRYDASGNLLTTSLTQAQIDALPAVSSSTMSNP